MNPVKKENQWSAEFGKVLRSQGALTYPCIASFETPRGWPDVHVVHRMWTGLVERKAEKTRIEPHQKVMMRDIIRRTKIAYYCVVARHVGNDAIVVTYVSDTLEECHLLECTYSTFLRSMSDAVSGQSRP